MCCSDHQRYYDLIRLPTRLLSGFRPMNLYQKLHRLWDQ
ncbi:hypothetical protein G436_3237 [Leptospira interrogans serovar Hardjo str. Norma]|uniref:Uncharacterized protein n=1 Tax=Leptospira interrogans serovar Hardjo str. Norma TaxID=1279460 RepID=A0A0M5LFN8_LEPIR|nr:hypothetical protein G436_3202 [Leptospira interrogans serovar Hardjo str. Norma]ALE40395.1 hypothetical protein G436_3237 [Leptospira interrogans serovar Hardjo str. Norma]